jgi:fibronectin type 3 domain-containing protein
MTITAANHQTKISWAKSSTATGSAAIPTYTIYWSNSPGVTKLNGNKISNVTSPYSHTGLTSGSMYYYVVTQTNSDVESAESLEVSAAPQADLPAEPSNITISPTDSKIQLKITPITGLKYNLYWSDWADGVRSSPPTKIANAFANGAVFIHTGLTNGVQYDYSIAAENVDGEGPRTKIFSAKPVADIPAENFGGIVTVPRPATPNGIGATPANQQVTLTWNIPTVQVPTVFDPASTPVVLPKAISSYIIYYSTSPITNVGNSNVNNVIIPGSTKPPISFTHNSNLANNTTYYYVITSVVNKGANGNPLIDGAGNPMSLESQISSQVSVIPVASTPAAPSGFSATSGAQQITLGWNKDLTPNVIYKIYYSVNAPESPELLVNSANLIATTANNSFIHTGLESNARYYYVVTTQSYGESAPSTLVSVKL